MQEGGRIDGIEAVKFKKNKSAFKKLLHRSDVRNHEQTE